MDSFTLDVHFTIKHKSGETYGYVKRANTHTETKQIVEELIQLNMIMQSMTNSDFKIGDITID